MCKSKLPERVSSYLSLIDGAIAAQQAESAENAAENLPRDRLERPTALIYQKAVPMC